MGSIAFCTIIISSQIPADVIDDLETSLSVNSIEVQKQPSRIIGADDIAFVATVAGGVATTATLIDYSIKIGKVINNWRKDLRKKNIEPKGKLNYKNQFEIDLMTATDEEIEVWCEKVKAWLSQK